MKKPLMKLRNLDVFRVVVAIFVVMIHTSPLASISMLADFLLTRVLARVGVPFFLMISGYFLFGKGSISTANKQRVRKFMHHVLILYLLAIVLYLPLSVYAGNYFSDPLRVFVSVFIDGTFYHLWYFPGVLTAIWLLRVLAKKLTDRQLLILTLILYLFALAGDAYGGLALRIPILRDVLAAWYRVSPYTRNGWFFMPVWLMLGHVMARGQLRVKHPLGLAGVSLSLMVVEALLLHQAHVQHHDSMYLFLLPLMIGLFTWLMQGSTQRCLLCRNFSMTLYLIHPWMIVVVRILAKVVHMPSLVLVSPLQFVLVFMLSSIVSLLLIYALNEMKKHREHGAIS